MVERTSLEAQHRAVIHRFTESPVAHPGRCRHVHRPTISEQLGLEQQVSVARRGSGDNPGNTVYLFSRCKT